jgi:hypothetical protein
MICQIPSGLSPNPSFGIITRRTGCGFVCFRVELLPNTVQPLLQPLRLDLLERLLTHAWRAFVGLRQIYFLRRSEIG